MKQALHVLRKDMVYLRLEIALLLMLCILLTLSSGDSGSAWWAQMLVSIAAAYTIARLVHAEPIAGTSQFWITRPYRAWSLLAAKLAFVLLFISLPLCLSQLVIVLRLGFPWSAILPGLLWSQMSAFAVVILPLVALASVTAGFVPFIFTLLVVLATGFSTQPLAWLVLSRPALAFPWPVSVEWVRQSAFAVILILCAAAVLWLQYTRRLTPVSRIVGAAGLIAAAAAYFYIPWQLALGLQGKLSDATTASVVVARDEAAKLSRAYVPGRADGRVQIGVPLVITSSSTVFPDAFTVVFASSDGRTWTGEAGGVNPSRRGKGRFDATVVLPQTFLTEAEGQTIRAQATLWLTLFEESSARKVRLSEGPANVMDGLQCYAGEFRYVWCRSAFRWPNRLISVKVNEHDIRPVRMLVSYSPFPGSIGFDPVQAYWASGSIRPEDEITIVSQKPVAHLRRNFDAGPFRIADLNPGR